MSLSIKLFGPLQVLVQGQPLPTTRSRKTLALLSLLALRQRVPIEREWISSLLWPDSDQKQALANLRTSLSELRNALGKEGVRITTPTRHTVSFDLFGASVDVVEFDRCITGGKRSELEQAVSLYTGPLLEGSTEEWVSQERGAREQDCLRSLQTLGDAAYKSGDYRAAIEWFRRATNLDPWWDAAHRGLMEALAKDGDLNEALQVYRSFENVLRSEAGTVPDEKTTALYTRLRAETRRLRDTPVAVQPKASGYVPNPLTALVGRDDEREDILALLRRSRLVTLTGLGGIGKTRIAISVATAVAADYPDGVWFVSLETLTTGDMVPRQIGSVLALPEPQGKSWLDSITEHLRTRRALLVLDNCEHLLDACFKVCTRLLQECGSLRVLATSREPLGITGESAWSVPGLPVPIPAQLPKGPVTMQRVMLGYEGIQLFLERAASAQKTFELNGSTAPEIAEICQSLEGVPLAIELAAAQVKALSLVQIRARLRDHLALLTGSERSRGSRQHALRSALDWSYELLTSTERILLRRLSVFAGGWSHEAAEQVASGDGIEKFDLGNALTSLVDKSLVQFQEDPPSGRYRMLETVRQYAAEKLSQSKEKESMDSRHRAWCLGLAVSAKVGLAGKDQAAWLDQLAVERANLLKAMAGFATEASGGLSGLQLADALWRFWNVRGPRAEGRECLQTALAHPDAQEATPERAAALGSAGVLAYHDNDRAGAKPFFLGALELNQALGSPRGIISCLNNLANVHQSEGDHEHARKALEDAIERARETDNLPGCSLLLVNLAYIYLDHLGEIAKARELYEEALMVSRQMGEPRTIAIALEGVGFAAVSSGDHVRAQASFEESVAIKEELKDQRMAWSIQFLGVAAYARGDLRVAEEHLHRCMALFEDSGDQDGMASTNKAFGDVDLATGNLAAAEARYTAARDLYMTAGERRNLPYVSARLGYVAVEAGKLDKARTLLNDALVMARDMGARWCATVCLDSIAHYLLAEGNVSVAVQLWAATNAERTRTGGKVPVPIDVLKLRDHDCAREELGDASFDSNWREGLRLSIEDASAVALSKLGHR